MSTINVTKKFMVRLFYEKKHYIFLFIILALLLFYYIYTERNDTGASPVNNSMFLTLIITFYLIIYSAKSITQEYSDKTIHSLVLFFGIERHKLIFSHFASILVLSLLLYISLLFSFFIFNLIILSDIFVDINGRFLWLFFSNVIEGLILITVSYFLALIFKSNIFANIIAILFFFLTPFIRNAAENYSILNLTFFPHMNIADVYNDAQTFGEIVAPPIIVLLNLGILVTLSFLLIKKQDIRL